MAYTRNPTWQDYDGTDDTLITAAKLENIEQGIEDAANEADAAIPSGLVDAKGDLIVATAADTLARLAAGTNGHVLTADSTAAAGVKWAAAAGGGSAPDYAANGYQTMPGCLVTGFGGSGGDLLTMTAGVTYHTGPFVLTAGRTLSNLDGVIKTGQATAKLRMAVVKIDAATAHYQSAPTDLLWQSGEIDASAYAGLYQTMSVALAAGTYSILYRVSVTGVQLETNIAQSLHYPPRMSLSGYRAQVALTKSEAYGSYASPPATSDGSVALDGVGARIHAPAIWTFSA